MVKFRILGFLLWLGMGSSLADGMAKDPTEPPGWRSNPVLPSQAAAVFTLSQIMINGNQRSVIINDQSLQEGDFIKGYIITKIQPNVVYLKNANGALMLPLLSEPVKITSVAESNNRDN